MDLKIRDSFQRVKQDITSLQSQVQFILNELEKNKEQTLELCKITKTISEKLMNLTEQFNSTYKEINQTLSTHLSTHNSLFKALKQQNLTISTGNEGVSTDRQTDRQTNRHTEKAVPEFPKFTESVFEHPSKQPIFKNPEVKVNSNTFNVADNAARILESLDSIKKEIRLKFKRLTEQEFTIFSAIYQLEEEQGGFTDYKALSKKLNLTESSIRDYVRRIINKGIPVEKKRINNKTIQLSVSKNLKKIASLSTIMKLRDL